MKSIMVPTTDVNSEEAVLVGWHQKNRSRVAKSSPLVQVETSKAVIEVEVPDDGYVLHTANVGGKILLNAPVAYLFEGLAELERYEADLARRRKEDSDGVAAGGKVRATQPALKRAEELGVDLEKLDLSRLVTVKDVEAAAASGAGPADYSTMPKPLAVSGSAQRLVLIGGALGAMQVLDILSAAHDQRAVAILDDDRAKWAGEVWDVPVIGGTDRLDSLFAARAFDAAIVTVGTSIPARVRFRRMCENLGIPLANAIDRTAKIAKDVRIGTGNIVCAYCHFGAGTTIGDNNFFSAYGSFDHHNILGSEITTGPNCVTSGLVKIGNRVKMGMGVLVEPHLEVGDDAQIASGAIILRSIPPAHAVKTKITTTVVTPIRNA